MEGAGIDDLTASIWTPPPQMLEQCSGPLEPDKSHQSLEELYEQFLLDDRHSSQNAEDISSDDGDVHHGPDPLLDSLRPDMDMATAIQSVDPNPRCFETLEPVQTLQEVSYTEPLNLVPDFYAYAVKACLLPIRRVQHELFTGYFRHVHPMFPVVDEHHFHEKHRQFMGREELLHPSDFMIYQAILAAGFGHLSERQLQRTSYKSVHSGQEALFDQVKARYDSRPTTDPVVLTQICLLLSLWSPGPADAQNNSYWLGLAFRHATAGNLFEDKPNDDGRLPRNRLLWWCCLVRDRVLALGMRRPYRLHRPALKDRPLFQHDFGLEAVSPSFTDIHSKGLEIRAFTWLCTLSDIMADMAVFQEKSRFARDWSGENVESTTRELEQAALFEAELRDWQQSFEADVRAYIQHGGDHDAPTPISILRIISSSLIAVLYQPYLHLSSLSGALSTEVIIDPLQRVKKNSTAVAADIGSLIQSGRTDVLPNWLVAWVILPVAVYHVNQLVESSEAPERVLMPFFNRFMRRTTGAQAMFLVLTRATKESFQSLDKDSVGAIVDSLDSVPSLDGFEGSNADSRERRRLLEAKILSHVTKALDYALELKC